MTTAFTARARRAEEFDALIQRASAPDLRDTRFAELAAVLQTLRTAEPVTPRPSFSADLRERLMLAAETALVPAAGAPRKAPQARPKVGRDKKIAATLGGFAIITASTSMAVAAQSALPGDTLYPLKRALENVHAGVQTGDGKGTTMLANASDRLSEVDQLSREGSRNPQVIAETLHDFATQATAASEVLLSDYRKYHHDSSLSALTTFTTDSLARLQTLEQLVPVEARGSLIQAASVLQQIAQQASDACPACTVVNAATAPVVMTTNTLVTALAKAVDGASDATTPTTPTPSTPTTRHGQPSKGTPAPPSTPPTTPPATTTPPSNPLQPGSTPPSSPQGTGGSSNDPTGPLSGLGDVLTGGTDASGSQGKGGLGGVLKGTVDALDGTISTVLGTGSTGKH